ncbi:MAG: hypothetical protein ABI310_04440 [Microbacteriaceae bacterium]
MSSEDDERVVAGIRSLLKDAVAQLTAAGARDEALAQFVPTRRTLGISRKPVMLPLGRVWRLGVFLLDREGALYATGTTTRAVDPLYRGFQSQSAETRRDYRAAAFRGPFERGETINFDAHAVELTADSLRSSHGPLLLRDGMPVVRWAATIDAAPVPFADYLRERVELLAHPPQGA